LAFTYATSLRRLRLQDRGHALQALLQKIEPKKKVLSLRIGPPTEPPKSLRRYLGTLVETRFSRQIGTRVELRGGAVEFVCSRFGEDLDQRAALVPLSAEKTSVLTFILRHTIRFWSEIGDAVAGVAVYAGAIYLYSLALPLAAPMIWKPGSEL